MASREDFGRLAYAAYCDMVGRPAVWAALGPRAQAGWIHVATTVRDRLALGMSHAYRPDERPQAEGSAMALAKSTAHGGSEEPTINETDDAALYAREKAHGNTEVRWSGEGPAPDAQSGETEAQEVERRQREQNERENLDAAREQRKDAELQNAAPAGQKPDQQVADDGTGVAAAKPSRSTRGKR